MYERIRDFFDNNGYYFFKSPQWQKVYSIVDRVEKSGEVGEKATILIRGESGTGKEIIANTLHYFSARRQKNFRKINCGAIPENLLESELFGHERGSFTSAYQQKKGMLEEANEGTIFLDEIAELPPHLQVKLLHYLESRTFYRVGGTKLIETNNRVIAATNQNLEQMIEQRKIREEFYYRINVVPIKLPPLRKMRGISDITGFANHLLEQYSAKHPNGLKYFSKEVLAAFESHTWYGNMREMKNVVESAVVLTEASQITLEDINHQISISDDAFHSLKLADHVEILQKRLVKSALEKTGWDKMGAAKELGISRPHLYGLMKKYGISNHINQ